MSAHGSADQQPSADAPGNVVLAGDSILANLVAHHVRELETAFDDALVTKVAVGGWRASDVIHHLEPLRRLNPDVLVLSVGLNDATASKPTPTSEFVRELVVISRATRAALVLVLPPTPERDPVPAVHPATWDRLAAYRSAVYAVDSLIARAVDLDAAADVPALVRRRVDDGVHLTDDATVQLVRLISMQCRDALHH